MVIADFTAITADVLEQLRAIMGENGLSTAQAELDLHAVDQSVHTPHPAEVVVWPQTGEQIATVLKLANDHRIPVTPWGVGTGLEGNAIPLHGGILLSMERMKKIIEVHADDFQVTVEPGIGHKDLNKALAKFGLFFPPDPGANASIGGMLANNAAGIRTVKYGASKDNVVQMKVALADGRIITVGSRSIKQSSGYNMLQLFVGSEGTLGVITEATIQLVPVPQHMTAMVVGFQSVEDAIEAVVSVRGSGIDVAALEYVDEMGVRGLAEAGMVLDERPTLLMEVHGAHEEALEQDIAIVKEICDELGAVGFQAMTDHTERQKLWHARHVAYETLIRMHPGQKVFIMDVAVPISAYPDLIAHARQSIADYGITGYMKGHAGDGNIHVELPYGDDETFQKVKAVNSSIVRKAIDLDGTATGEHGVGIGKSAYMEDEHGETLNVMRDIKALLDPNGILNPGKIFPQA